MTAKAAASPIKATDPSRPAQNTCYGLQLHAGVTRGGCSL